ncbi:PAAR domain-containing protein [Haloarcula sp. S1CR25-12]|uniref:PAAR domain-containing protein n=1 Tax=Haloarcula saliterrae TaxID=2950534 RepID=A0ABU2FFA6_9EURY|nr:PAAR domain-containing protein [Haloarcula sp. S1CR25-12]MDS0260500.1 PAAR domain-containing protein [Haloarcula sp. S1CR25-12]
MKPAARLGDSTAHGKPLSGGTGSPNVLIGGKPAWRAGMDMHVCPLTSGLAPHVGGVVGKGSTSVLINGMPAARMGDKIIESGPPNTILSGDTTVLIG